MYGYDKTIGDYFNLAINEEEAAVIRQIYKWYIEEGYGAAKIANMLNAKGIRTKRNCQWSQNATCRILTNELYTGKIINGKQEVADFLTGQRTEKDETEWMVTERPELRIIDDCIYPGSESGRGIDVCPGDGFCYTQKNKRYPSSVVRCRPGMVWQSAGVVSAFQTTGTDYCGGSSDRKCSTVTFKRLKLYGYGYGDKSAFRHDFCKRG